VSTARCISQLKKEGWNIVMLEQSPKSVPYDSLKLTKKLRDKTVLVVGSEVEGIKKSILKYADVIIEIPMRGAKESLNVSVAFGVASYALNK
jgi:tRNA G18 (ribose-2'-O)-methylase SpoU